MTGMAQNKLLHSPITVVMKGFIRPGLYISGLPMADLSAAVEEGTGRRCTLAGFASSSPRLLFFYTKMIIRIIVI
jgi:hypothetical protein